MKQSVFHPGNFKVICDFLGQKDEDLQSILKQYGYPPIWTRPATFQTLILTILEQQVSLASAYAAFKKLKEKTGYITPGKIIALNTDEMRSCYFSRQKIIYAKELAASIISKKLILKNLKHIPDDEVRNSLKRMKGIGDWTVDIYMIHALQRQDVFPIGDLAMVHSLKEIKRLPKHVKQEKITSIAEFWRPYRSIATMLLWHSYIKKRNIKIAQ